MSIQYLDRGENEFLISVFIGAVGSWLANITAKLLIYLKIDDAVGATCVHGTEI